MVETETPMRVLVLGPKDGQTWNHVADAFADSDGHETRWSHLMVHLDNRTELGQLPAMLKKWQFQVVIMSREHNLVPVSAYIRKFDPTIKQVCWNVDARPNADFGPVLTKLFNMMDIFYTVAAGNVPLYQEMCPDTDVRWLPQGADRHAHGPQHLTEEDYARYGCEVMFAGDYMGVWHQGRQQLLDTVARSFDLKVYSKNDGNYVKNEEHAKACQCAKICLAMSHSPEIYKYQSVRNWKIMASGGFMMARESNGLDEMFPPGTYGTFKDETDIVENIQWWLDRPEIRDTSRKDGMIHVYDHGLYKHRIRQILDDVEA
jgi:hypothetical protein